VKISGTAFWNCRGGGFTTEELDDFTHKRNASITKDHVILFTYMNGKTLTSETIINGALKELTALLFPCKRCISCADSGSAE
jgi:hypothetical protein